MHFPDQSLTLTLLLHSLTHLANAIAVRVRPIVLPPISIRMTSPPRGILRTCSNVHLGTRCDVGRANRMNVQQRDACTVLWRGKDGVSDDTSSRAITDATAISCSSSAHGLNTLARRRPACLSNPIIGEIAAGGGSVFPSLPTPSSVLRCTCLTNGDQDTR